MCKESELAGTKCTCGKWIQLINKQAMLNYIHGYLNINYGFKNKNKDVADKLAAELSKFKSADVKEDL